MDRCRAGRDANKILKTLISCTSRIDCSSIKIMSLYTHLLKARNVFMNTTRLKKSIRFICLISGQFFAGIRNTDSKCILKIVPYSDYLSTGQSSGNIIISLWNLMTVDSTFWDLHSLDNIKNLCIKLGKRNESIVEAGRTGGFYSFFLSVF